MTNEEEFSARSQLKWTREGDACGPHFAMKSLAF